MEKKKSSRLSRSSAIEETPKVVSQQQERIVFHLFYAPAALLVFIGSFIYQCVVIPTPGQFLFCLAAMGISILILKKTGRIVYRTLQNEEVPAPASHLKATAIRRLLAYYAIYMAIAVTTVMTGAYLNTNHLDHDKAASRSTHFELIFRLPSTFSK
ncbi:MAG: hypothetical protein K2H60_15550 [Muribaculaceae bacterium]|nr:hypothetical protein [Muribaculaceae bacterium]